MAKQHEVKVYVQDGIKVKLDLSWCRSWEGIALAARMSDEKEPDGERLMATGNYYSKACPNIDEVAAALDSRSDDEVTANDVMTFVTRAVHAAQGEEQSKN